MAIAIKSIPTLQGELAEEFVKKADASFHNKRQSQKANDKHFTSLNNILKKANMK
ncbi:hypothetical protein H8784_16255 [Parabacteroides acidifaciens]|uniref:Uncharacterized protein n=1 Tax=Parabacteroides acidifaciens TaxID=2290935 RepID=A0ABR7P648_9BACT|nr:hypothetical protein [Parabacteroides acidifaciens]MBC8603266.1 hypothetical protein [Parabacteroides acidifaciens]